MFERSVKVILLSCPPQQPYLEFSLIFDDGFEKHYQLDDYAVKHFRGANFRDIFEQQAREYYEDIGEPAEILKLIFI